MYLGFDSHYINCIIPTEVILLSDRTTITKKQGRQACYKADEASVILCDKNKERNEAVSELSQRLLRSKWNPMATYSYGTWRFYVEIIDKQLYSYGITRIEIKAIAIVMLTNVT